MSSSTSMLAVVSLCVLTVGRVPIPTKSVVHYGVQGRLLEAADGAAIARRQVFVAVDGREYDKKTNRRGEFKIAPELHHFWTWLGGPMWSNATRATVDITIEGYAAYHRKLVVVRESIEMPAAPDQDRLNGNYLALGDIEMKKRQPDSGAK